MEESILVKISEKSGLDKTQVNNMLQDYIQTNNLDINDKDNWQVSDIAGIMKMFNLKNTFNNLQLISML